MTKRFSVMYTCAHCGMQTSAETAFGRWMRNNSRLKSEDGIVRTDTDHTILRYKTHDQGRQFQLMIDIEVKEFGAEPDASQGDIEGFKHQLLIKKGSVSKKGKVNQLGEDIQDVTTLLTKRLKSRISGRFVLVRYCGYHLLQFEKTNPDDSSWIKWDHREISKDQLIGLMSLTLHPFYPHQNMPVLQNLRDRHKKPSYPLLDPIDPHQIRRRTEVRP